MVGKTMDGQNNGGTNKEEPTTENAGARLEYEKDTQGRDGGVAPTERPHAMPCIRAD